MSADFVQFASQDDASLLFTCHAPDDDSEIQVSIAATVTTAGVSRVEGTNAWLDLASARELARALTQWVAEAERGLR